MAAIAKKKAGAKGLGRGLDALLGDAGAAPARRADPDAAGGPRRELPIEFISANPDQPRRTFADDAIEELAASIRARGLLQPILVRPKGPDAYEIVAGERRWRAAQRAKLHKIPVIIRELSDEETAEIALIENVQRVDLNPVEEALAYRRLVDAFGRSQDDIAKAVGKSRSHVANIMRLLNLPDEALDALRADLISMGHARALLAAPDPGAALEAVILRGLSVRQTEALTRGGAPATPKDNAKASPPASDAARNAGGGGKKDADTRALERDLAGILGLEVTIDHSKKGAGVVSIAYSTLDQLDDVCRRLMGSGV